MVDTRIRKNERCVIGLPACDYVYSSQRSCFIAYGFDTSALEKDVLRSVLEERGIEPVEAGGEIQPGKFAFCTKICSKIIVAQFCIVIINNDTFTIGGRNFEKPNANVNMEYGFILGHNKYIIPFQREDQKLPFNVGGLDTIKYDNSNFKNLAIKAIDQAIKETSQNIPNMVPVDQVLDVYLLSRNVIVATLRNEGDRNIFELGSAFGFNLLMSFDGMSYIFLGNFTALRTEIILWRLKKLIAILTARFGSIEERRTLGIATAEQVALVTRLKQQLQIWVLVTSDEQRSQIESWGKESQIPFRFEVFTVHDVQLAVQNAVST